MNSLGLTILILVIGMVVAAPRRWAIIGICVGVLYLTQQQQIAIGGFNMYAIRFVELAGFIRVVARREFSFSKLEKIDRTLIALYLYTTIVFLLRSSRDQAYQIGLAVDAFLCYFTFRGLITGMEDYRWFLRAFLILLVPYALLVVWESLTAHNPFAIIGGEEYYGEFVRGGRVRCFGSFRHPSLLGTLGGTFFPMYLALLFIPRERIFGIAGLFASLAVVWASNSGGPLNCVAMAVVGWLFWRSRANMRFVRRTIVACLVFLAVFMKAPIWYLPAKISDISGGDGYHRSHLMDMAAQTVTKWGLDGMSLIETHDWFAYSLVTGGADMTNQYLQFGIAAGLGAMILFIVLLTRGFSHLGSAMATLRSGGNVRDDAEYILWGLGVMLLVHIANWLGIVYFDQTYVIWYMQLAVIATVPTAYILDGQSNKASESTCEPVQNIAVS